ncbi:MAG: class I fructose-bisphosphate aldolase family protein [Candidatus Bathyarchaeia archaeon]
MSDIGKEVRLRRILGRGGRTVILALDHGVEHGPSDFPERVLDARVIVREAVKGGANAIMMHKGLAIRTREEWAGKIPLILKITGRTALAPDESAVQAVVGGIEEAIALGADGVAATVYVGAADEPIMLRDFGALVKRCSELGMPMLALMYPRGPKVKDKHGVEYVRYAARLGGELGADVIKTYYTGSTETFREVVRAAQAPVVAAGGPKLNTAREALSMVKSVMDAGAIGVTIGRNVWASADPVGMLSAIRRIVFGNQSVDEALKEVKAF